MVAGPATGGALLAHTIAGLLDSRRSLTHPPCLFAPFNYDAVRRLRRCAPFYRRELKGKRVLLADDVRNTGETFARCAALVREAGGTVVATVEIYDRLEAMADLGVPNVALAEYKAPENFKAADVPAVPGGRAHHAILKRITQRASDKLPAMRRALVTRCAPLRPVGPVGAVVSHSHAWRSPAAFGCAESEGSRAAER